MRNLVLTRQRPRAYWPTLGNIENELDRFVGNFLGDSRINTSSAWVPAMDLRETDESYSLVADLPGLKKEDIEIAVADNVLTIKGERKEEQERNRSGWHVFERGYGAFQRAFHLPRGVEADKVSASYENGVLTVTLPKPERARKRQIEVKVN